MEQKMDIKNWVNGKWFPFYLGGILFTIAAFFMLIVFIAAADKAYVLTVVGIELLFYMLLNAFASLMVKHIGKYMQRAVLVYVVNLLALALLLYLLMGSTVMEFERIFPAFEALIFCFFSSLMIIALIRSVVNFFKEEGM